MKQQCPLSHSDGSISTITEHPLTATYEIQEKIILVLWAPGGETRPYKVKASLSDKKNDWAYYLRKHFLVGKDMYLRWGDVPTRE